VAVRAIVVRSPKQLDLDYQRRHSRQPHVWPPSTPTPRSHAIIQPGRRVEYFSLLIWQIAGSGPQKPVVENPRSPTLLLWVDLGLTEPKVEGMHERTGQAACSRSLRVRLLRHQRAHAPPAFAAIGPRWGSVPNAPPFARRPQSSSAPPVSITGSSTGQFHRPVPSASSIGQFHRYQRDLAHAPNSCPSSGFSRIASATRGISY
jgi:hypothetical protein